MPSPLEELLTHNAFRTLGLSASATNAEVDAAARRMRIWPDPSRIPPTQWDQPALGSLDRSRPAIDRALTTLRQPQSRLAERVLWYMGSAPVTADDSALSVDPLKVHAYALAALHAAVLSDPQIAANATWSDVVDRVNTVANLDRFTEKLQSIEAESGFEVRASEAEVAAAVRDLPGRLAMGLATQAIQAIERNDLASCLRIGQLVRQVSHADKTTSRLLEAMENALVAACSEIVADLEKRLRTDFSNPEPFAFDNRHAARLNAHRCDVRVYPLLHAITSISDDVALIERAGSSCCEALVLLALGWEWGGDYVQADDVLTDAMRWAGNSPSSHAVRQAIERVRPEAERQRRRSTGTFEVSPRPDTFRQETSSSDSPAPSRHSRKTAKSDKGAAAVWVFALIVISGLVRLGMQSANRSSSSVTSPAIESRTSDPYTRGRTSRELIEDLSRGLSEQNRLNPIDVTPYNPYALPPLPTTRPTTPGDYFNLGEATREQ